MANGWGSRDKARVALRRIQHVPKQEENSIAGAAVQSDEETLEAMPLAGSSDTQVQQMQQSSVPKRPIIRLDKLVEFDISPFLSYKLWPFLFYDMLL